MNNYKKMKKVFSFQVIGGNFNYFNYFNYFYYVNSNQDFLTKTVNQNQDDTL